MDTQSTKVSATRQKSQSPLRPAKSTAKSPRKIHKYDIFFTIFVLTWTMLATVAGQILAAYPLRWILGDKLQEPGWMLLYYLLAYAIGLGMLIWIPPALVKLYRKNHPDLNNKAVAQVEQDLASTPTEMGVQHLPTFIDIGLAPIGYVIYLFMAAVLTSLMSAFTWFNVDQAQDVGFGYFVTDLDRIFALLAVVFIAPIAEELIMRGWLYGKVRRKLQAPVAILLVSFVFAVLHGQWNVGVSVFALSIVLCTLREITGTIWSGMLLHILSNGIAFYLLYVAI